ncbi:Uncharacterised protein [Mycobacteroides abscessus subsp. abscessus]|nr:Uncharacterised protein [Mycobacteroides abscessus subsp. abscessus]
MFDSLYASRVFQTVNADYGGLQKHSGLGRRAVDMYAAAAGQQLSPVVQGVVERTVELVMAKHRRQEYAVFVGISNADTRSLRDD